jgi:hypothetical protein
MAFQLSSKTQSIHKTVSFPAALHLRAPRQQHLLQKHQEIRSAGVQGINMAGSVRASAQVRYCKTMHTAIVLCRDPLTRKASVACVLMPAVHTCRQATAATAMLAMRFCMTSA